MSRSQVLAFFDNVETTNKNEVSKRGGDMAATNRFIDSALLGMDAWMHGSLKANGITDSRTCSSNSGTLCRDTILGCRIKAFGKRK